VTGVNGNQTCEDWWGLVQGYNDTDHCEESIISPPAPHPTV